MDLRSYFFTATLIALSLVRLEAATNASFSIQRQDGVDWLVKPNGERFFSFGVCVVSQGASHEDFNPTNPGYAAFQHYDNSNRWAAATLQRLKSWKVTTIGGWSDFGAFKQQRNADVAFTPALGVGMTCGVPWWDMWDTNIIARMHAIAREQILPLRDDPRLLGYYSDNEMGWWNATLFKMTLEQAPASGQRQRLMKLLRETYHNNWSELSKDFEPDGVASFEELNQRGMLYLRPGSNGIRIYRRFLSLMAERYYSLVHEIIRAYDPRGLILGDRYQSFFYPEVARACGKHVDASSSNLSVAWDDGTFPRFYFETLHALTGKPLLVTEFYMAAQENRSGNKNDSTIFPTVTTQKQRAAGFRGTIENLAKIPFVLGTDWFQYFDEPSHGRGDGENFNFGLVDIHDRPYETLAAAAAALDLNALKTHPAGRSDASAGVPPAPPNPFANFAPLLALKHWDRERGFVKPLSEFPLADLYICWNKKAIYLGLYAQDIVEKAFYRDKQVPEVDRAEWTISIGRIGRAESTVSIRHDEQPIHVRIGSGAKAVLSEPDLHVASVSGAYMNTRIIAAIEIPAKRFGWDRFKSGDTIELSSMFFTHCRSDRVEWKDRLTLSNRR